MDEHLRSEFNEWARAGRGEGMERGHRPVGERAIEKMNIPLDARVLDVGCGSGWASRLMAQKAIDGSVVGIDISDEMVQLSADSSSKFSNVEFRVASAERLPFEDSEFSHVFSMESLYYYTNMTEAVSEIYRVIGNGGIFVSVVDLYLENEPSHQWISTLKVPVHLLSGADYQKLFEDAGFVNVSLERVRDPRPVPDDYSSGSFNSREDYVLYRENGSLMVRGEVTK